MKRNLPIFLTITMLFLFCDTISIAQTAGEPPIQVKAKFNAKYPEHANAVKWKQNGADYQATFRSNKGREVVSSFDKNGKWIKTRTELKEADWTDNTRKYIKDVFNGYQYKNGYIYDGPQGRTYELNLRSENEDYRLEFDDKGYYKGRKPTQ